MGLNCFILYETNGIKTSNTASMILPTQNSNTIAVSSVDVSFHATVNGKSLLSISYENKGTKNIDDAVVNVIGNVSESTQSIELGTVAAEKSYTKYYNVIFAEAGNQTISLVLSYTDINGQHVDTNLGSFKVSVDEENNTSAVKFTESSLLKWSGKIITLIALVCAAIAAFMYIMKRK